MDILKLDDIELVPILDSGFHLDAFQVISKMYSNYVVELRNYDNHIEINDLVKPEDNPAVNYYLIAECTYDRKNIIGFVLTSEPPFTFSGHDLYIGEFYIEPLYRRKHLGEKAVKTLIKYIKNSCNLDAISMFILNNNKNAKAFWSKTLEQSHFLNSFEDGGVDAHSLDWENCKFYYWK